jgi:hypothetical protein
VGEWHEIDGQLDTIVGSQLDFIQPNLHTVQSNRDFNYFVTGEDK